MKFLILLFLLLNFANAHTYDVSKKEVNIQKVGVTDLKSGKSKEIEHLHYYLRQTIKKDRLIKFSLHNSSNVDLKKDLVFGWGNANLKLVIKENAKEIDDAIIYDKNNIGFFIYNLTLKKHTTYDILIYHNTEKKNDDFKFIYVLDEGNFLKKILTFERLYNSGFLLGSILILTIFSLFNTIIFKEKYHIYYTLFLFSIILLTSDFRLFLYEVFGNQIFIIINIVLTNATYIFVILFTKSFLNLKKDFTFINNIASALVIYYVCIIISKIIFIDITYYVHYINMLFLFFVYAGYKKFRVGDVSYLFYTISCVFFTVSTLVYIYNAFSDIKIDFHTYIQVFTVGNALFFSIAIQHKIRNLYLEKEKISEQRLKDKEIMFMQSKFAAMGEMIGNIAHQWRQPINNISAILSNIQVQYELGKLNLEKLNSKISDSNGQLKYMSDTIEDFMNFYSRSKVEVEISLKEVCEEALVLSKSIFDKNHIQIEKEYKDDTLLLLKDSELVQVLVVLINNSKDAFVMNEIKSRTIKISTANNCISLEDNAGGVPEDILKKIFDPYFTTKSKDKGTGLGLYMAKQILENSFNASIHAQSSENKTKFTINLKNS